MRASNRRGPCLARGGPEAGNAIVESLGVLVGLMLPAVAFVVGFAALLEADYAAAAAAREGARAYVRAESGVEARVRMERAVAVALADRGAQAEGETSLSCSASPCLSPGATVSVSVAARARLAVLGRDVAVRRTATMPVDELRGVRP